MKYSSHPRQEFEPHTPTDHATIKLTDENYNTKPKVTFPCHTLSIICSRHEYYYRPLKIQISYLNTKKHFIARTHNVDIILFKLSHTDTHSPPTSPYVVPYHIGPFPSSQRHTPSCRHPVFQSFISLLNIHREFGPSPCAPVASLSSAIAAILHIVSHIISINTRQHAVPCCSAQRASERVAVNITSTHL